MKIQARRNSIGYDSKGIGILLLKGSYTPISSSERKGTFLKYGYGTTGRVSLAVNSNCASSSSTETDSMRHPYRADAIHTRAYLKSLEQFFWVRLKLVLVMSKKFQVM